MNLDVILELASTKYESFQSLWSIYVAIVTVIFAILLSNSKALNSVLPRLLIMIAFIAFAATSVVEMEKTCIDRYLLSSKARKILKIESVQRCGFFDYQCKNKILETYKESPIKSYVLNMTYSYSNEVLLFHLLIDSIILLLIWFLPRVLIRLKPSNDVLKKKIEIKKSQLPAPIISYNKQNDIWHLEDIVFIGDNKHLIEFNDYKNEISALEIPKGFEFDLASIPRFLWSFIAPFELSIIAPLVHDYIYKCDGRFSVDINNKLVPDKKGIRLISRKEADDLFLLHMKLENIGFIKRWLAFYAVQIFGTFYWED